MNITSKTLIPNKEWIIKDDKLKIGSVLKNKKGISFFRKGQKYTFNDLKELQEKFGIDLENTDFLFKNKTESAPYLIYDFLCSSKPYDPVYNLKKKLPLFAKSSKSKSRYCAGFYVIKFRKGWVKSFCPKLITLERYQYFGPFKTEQDMKTVLNTLNKNEAT
jgi:hypothetical protein